MESLTYENLITGDSDDENASIAQKNKHLRGDLRQIFGFPQASLERRKMYLHRFGSSDAGSVIDCQTIFKNISKIVTENAFVNTKNNSSQLKSMPQTIKSHFFKPIQTCTTRQTDTALRFLLGK